MSYRGEGVNEYGTAISLFTCDWCGREFSVCPAMHESHRDQWNGCLSEDCESYEPMRISTRPTVDPGTYTTTAGSGAWCRA